jgi:hypothetical protein
VGVVRDELLDLDETPSNRKPRLFVDRRDERGDGSSRVTQQTPDPLQVRQSLRGDSGEIDPNDDRTPVSLGEQVEVDAPLETGEVVKVPHSRACEEPRLTSEPIRGPYLCSSSLSGVARCAYSPSTLSLIWCVSLASTLP